MIDCLFCNPARSRILCESDGWYARYDNYPATPGHLEIVPHAHVESWFSLSPVEQLEGLYLLAEAADVLTPIQPVDGWNIGVNDGVAAGRTIDHLHIHLIPRRLGDQGDPRGGIRRGLPNGDPDAWASVEAQIPAAVRDGAIGSSG